MSLQPLSETLPLCLFTGSLAHPLEPTFRASKFSASSLCWGTSTPVVPQGCSVMNRHSFPQRRAWTPQAEQVIPNKGSECAQDMR